MTLKEIVAVTGLSKSTVHKILYVKGGSDHFKKETVAKVAYYRDYDKLIDHELRNGTFEAATDAILNRATRRDARNIEDVLELAKDIIGLRAGTPDTCKYFHTIKFTAKDIFLDQDFATLCNIAIRLIRQADVRVKLMEMRDASRIIRKKLGTLTQK